MEEVIITCSPENIASRKTCEYSGGELIGIVDVPSWHERFKTGREKNLSVYRKIMSIGGKFRWKY